MLFVLTSGISDKTLMVRYKNKGFIFSGPLKAFEKVPKVIYFCFGYDD